MDRNVKCPVCDREEFHFVWTDRHGVGACITCNSSFQIYHYGEDGKLMEKPPECLVREDWLPLLRRYWQEKKKRIPNPHVFTRSYDQCTEEEHYAFRDWCKEHEAELPAKEAKSDDEKNTEAAASGESEA